MFYVGRLATPSREGHFCGLSWQKTGLLGYDPARCPFFQIAWMLSQEQNNSQARLSRALMNNRILELNLCT